MVCGDTFFIYQTYRVFKLIFRSILWVVVNYWHEVCSITGKTSGRDGAVRTRNYNMGDTSVLIRWQWLIIRKNGRVIIKYSHNL